MGESRIENILEATINGIDDWLAQTNPISVGNGKEIYCRSVAV